MIGTCQNNANNTKVQYTYLEPDNTNSTLNCQQKRWPRHIDLFSAVFVLVMFHAPKRLGMWQKQNLNLAVQGMKEIRRICGYCRKTISKKQLLCSPTQLPVFLPSEDDTPPIRQFGLYVTTNYVVGEKICPFFGHEYWSSSEVPEKGKDRAF